MGVDINPDSDLDVVLTEVGAFGLFQIAIYFLICIPSTLSASFVVNYMFTANALDYRCRVPECDVDGNNRDVTYDQPWLNIAIPSTNGKLDNCVRYAPVNRNGSNGGISEEGYQCSSEMFNTSLTIPCTEFVYATDETNIQTEFNIHCSDSYKLGLVGTVDNIARFVALPLVGLLSDRFGRLTMVVSGIVCGSIIGLIKSFSTSYFMYIILNFFESCGTSTFAGTFVLALEGVHSDYRVLCSMLLAATFPIGEIIFGVAAMYIHDFRYLIRVLYAPGLLFFVYFWIVPESIRWLLITGRVDRAIKILRITARINGKQLSERSIEAIISKYSTSDSNSNNNEVCYADTMKRTSMIQSLRTIFKSKTLCRRFLNCCYIWISCLFCYYGLSLSALSIRGENRYTSFIYVVLIEIPGVLIAIPLLKRMERRKFMSVLLFITAVSTIITPWIPEERSNFILISFMIGKAAISCAVNGLYVFTAEQWPTNIRTTTLNSCSMIGRIGSMIAPMTAVLATQFESLPAILFGCMAIIGSVVVLYLPETYGRKLPDTIEEAKHL